MRHPLFIFWIVLISVHADVQSMASRFARLGTYAPEAFASLKNAWQPARSMGTQTSKQAGMTVEGLANKYSQEIAAEQQNILRQMKEWAETEYELSHKRSWLKRLLERPVESQSQARALIEDLHRLKKNVETDLFKAAWKDPFPERAGIAGGALRKIDSKVKLAIDNLRITSPLLPEMSSAEQSANKVGRNFALAAGLTGLGLMGYGMYKAAPTYEERA